MTLEAVANEDGEFGLAWDGVLPAQESYSQDLTLPGLVPFGEQSVEKFGY